MWELITNLEERSKWDKERWVESRILGEEDGGTVMHIVLPKPPVPLVYARDLCLVLWRDEAFGEGQRA